MSTLVLILLKVLHGLSQASLYGGAKGKDYAGQLTLGLSVVFVVNNSALPCTLNIEGMVFIPKTIMRHVMSIRNIN